MNKNQLPQSSDHEKSLTTANLLRDNLKTLTGIASPRNGTFFSSLLLLAPEGDERYTSGDPHFKPRITANLAGDCDPVNRAMLTKLYELAHINIDDPSIETSEYVSNSGEACVRREVTYQSEHGLDVTEIYAKVDDWESFSVTVAPNKDRPINLRFLFEET